MTTTTMKHRKAVNPAKLIRTLQKDSDGMLFLESQVKQGRALAGKLNLRSDIQMELESRHSIEAIALFFYDYSDILVTQHYLYALPNPIASPTIRFSWLSVEKPIYTLDSYSYCLLSRQEYDTALSAGLSKESILDIGRAKPSLKELSIKQRDNKKKKTSSSFTPIKQEPIESFFPSQSYVDVFGCIGHDGEALRQDSTIVDVTGATSDTAIAIEIEEKPAVPKSLKRSATTDHLETILNYSGDYDEEDYGSQQSNVVVPMVKETRIKRYKKEDGEKEGLRDAYKRLTLHLQLEQELRDINEKLHAQRLTTLEQRFDTLQQELQAKDQEIATLRQEQKKETTNTKKPRRVVKAKKTATTTTSTKNQPVEPNLAPMVVEETNPLALALVVTPVQVDDQQALAQALALQEYTRQCDETVEKGLIAYTENGTNLGVTYSYRYKLTSYLEKFLDATNAMNSNKHIQALLDHPFLEQYRVFLLANMASHPVTNDQESVRLHLLQKEQVLNKESLEVRFNQSNVNLHTWFLCKAIEWSQEKVMKHRPVIMENFAYEYAPEILHKWYPRLDSGNGFIVTADLKIVARPTQQGQGHGKHCCFCGLQYIACSNGILKHAHQVKNCDYLAQLSNDERVILNQVLAKRRDCKEFAEHVFIRAPYTKKSLLRLATREECEHQRYVAYGPTGECLRINMPVLLDMRQRTYTEFVKRIDSLDTHPKDMNLNAQHFAYQLDCFGHTGPSFLETPKDDSKIKNKTQCKTRKSKKESRKFKEDGYLYKTLMDYEGNQFRKSKFGADGKESLRKFDYDTTTGFGDDMYFGMPPLPGEEEQRLEQALQQALQEDQQHIDALRNQEEKEEEYNRFLELMEASLRESTPASEMDPLPPHPLVIKAPVVNEVAAPIQEVAISSWLAPSSLDMAWLRGANTSQDGPFLCGRERENRSNNLFIAGEDEDSALLSRFYLERGSDDILFTAGEEESSVFSHFGDDNPFASRQDSLRYAYQGFGSF